MLSHQSGKKLIKTHKINILIHGGSEHINYKKRRISLRQLRRIAIPVNDIYDTKETKESLPF